MSRPYFIHIRTKQEQQVQVKGGLTIAVIGDPDNGFRYGVAKCSPKDNYCKSTGRQLATGRAFEKKVGMSLPDDITTTAAAEKHLRTLYTV
jgi:hypothetical protein